MLYHRENSTSMGCARSRQQRKRLVNQRETDLLAIICPESSFLRSEGLQACSSRARLRHRFGGGPLKS